jgi:hypothetical protein
MQYLKNIAFTMLIRANGRIREFNFRKKRSAEKPLYEIDVCDESGSRHYFTAAKISDRWQLSEPNVPVWVKEVANSFHELIEEQEPRIGYHLS